MEGNHNLWFKKIIVSVGVGLVIVYSPFGETLGPMASMLVEVLMLLMKMISVPIIFFSLFGATKHVSNLAYGQTVVRMTLSYTIVTTACAALLAMLGCFICFTATGTMLAVVQETGENLWSIGKFVRMLVPATPVDIFSKNNVLVGVIFAIFFSLVTERIGGQERETLHRMSATLLSLFLKSASMLMAGMPYLIWAFIVVLFQEINVSQGAIDQIPQFFLVVCGLFFVHALIVVPVMLGYKMKMSVWRLIRCSLPSLTLAFWTQSSSLTVPTSMGIAQKHFGLKKQESEFVAALCSALNMNGAAITIYSTVYFVMSQSVGVPSFAQSLAGVCVAVLAAMGNSGVPMGGYFMSTAILASVGAPTSLLAVLFPIMVLIDKVETTLNIWVDLCIMHIVGERLKHERK